MDNTDTGWLNLRPVNSYIKKEENRALFEPVFVGISMKPII